MSNLVLTANQSFVSSSFGPKISSIGENVVYESPKQVYQDICVLKPLNKAKFPVYLVYSRVNKQNYAIKVFAYKDGKQHPYFKNETRFACLQHPHVIRNLYIGNEKETISKGVLSKVSYTVMEYACYGDFFDFIMNHRNIFEEKLVRTFFRQLIEGLEYLHQNGVSHMDLKLENLLLGKDCSLKIADFDLSHFQSDDKILSKGTKFYRSPEIIDRTCKNTNAADVYSAGIILFTLKTQGLLPHSEESTVKGVNFYDLLHKNDKRFWSKHLELQKKDDDFFSDDFKDLFISMIQPRPEKRASIDTIKKSEWYNGARYSNEELKGIVKGLFGY